MSQKQWKIEEEILSDLEAKFPKINADTDACGKVIKRIHSDLQCVLISFTDGTYAAYFGDVCYDDFYSFYSPEILPEKAKSIEDFERMGFITNDDVQELKKEMRKTKESGK